MKNTLTLVSGLFVAATCSAACPRSVLVHPDEFTDKWIDRAKSMGVETIAMHPVGGDSAHRSLAALLELCKEPSFRQRVDRAIALGLNVEYEFHAGTWLLPRELFREHPEYFRVGKDGKRTDRLNFCVSNDAALTLVARRACELVKGLYRSSPRYYFWLDDSGDSCCHCERCAKLSPSDQQLIVINRMLTEMRKLRADAKLAYLAYCDTLTPPKSVKPVRGVFAEFAPIHRRWDRPVAEQPQAVSPDNIAALLDYFGRPDSRVLEYWLDNSLFSHWTKPPKPFSIDPKVVRADLKWYEEQGFAELATFACYLGPDYEKLWGEPNVSAFACEPEIAASPTPFPRFGKPQALTAGKEHLLASYFAIDSWSPNLRYLLALETELNGRLPEREDVAKVGLIDLHDHNRWIPVTETRCWNFQEAAMGHWISDDEFLFNDVVDGKFSTVILNWKTGQRRSLPYPTAAVSPDRTKIISINYARIRLTRPDYGYAGPGQDAMRDVTYPENDGLWLVDLKTGEAKLIVTIAALKDKMHKIYKKEGLAYFCHVVFSKTGKRIFFLGRTIEDFKTWCETVAFTCNADGSNVRVAQDWYSSHFNWIDDDSMVVTAGWHRGPMGHGVFTVGKENESRRLAPGVLDWDGHCIWMPGGKFMSTDGYWDRNKFNRTWAIMRVEDEAVKTVGQFFVPEGYRSDFWRCDLHPHFRSDGRSVVFNSVHEGTRQVYMMDISTPGRETTKLSGKGWTCDGEPVSVPHSWNVKDAATGPRGNPQQSGFSVEKPFFVQKAATYVRTLPPRAKGKRAFVKCEGASQKAVVKVNGVEVGRHAGAYTAFTFEVTDAMKDNAPNRLEIIVDNRFDRDLPPTSADFTPFGGLYRDVWLIETDPTCIAPARDAAGGVKIRTDPKTGKVIAEIELDQFEKWSPEEPNLYELEIKVKKGNQEDTVTKTFGFRDAEFREDGFYLNGKKRQLHGVNRHQDVGPEHGWCATREDDERDVRIMKEMGCDAVRLCHYPQSAQFLDVCDRLGLLAWSEIPLVNTMTDSDAFRSNTVTVAKDMVEERMHHPSVFTWGLYNEMSSIENCTPAKTAAEWLKPAAEAMRKADPTRPVTAATCEWLGKAPINYITDVLGFNLYPHWYDRKRSMKELIDSSLAKCPQKSIAVSEYGAGGSVKHHTLPVKPNDPGAKFHSEEYQTEILVKDGRDLFAHPNVWGTFLWCMFDFPSCCRDEGDAPGTNDKGVVTRDRLAKKDGFYFYQANWTKMPVLHLVGSKATKADAETIDVTGFSNVGAAELFVNGVSLGTRDPDAAKTVTWKDVRLATGANKIELKAGGRVASATWTRE